MQLKTINQKIIKKVFVSGCFDLFHSGHVEFLKNANKYGDVYVCIGSDETIKGLKGKYPIINQNERKFMIESIKYIKECRVNRGNGILDFKKNLIDISPDIFIVNEDGNSNSKLELCEQNNIDYKILKRTPYNKLPIRSSTKLKKEITIPFRIDLAGGWVDQLSVNKLYPGSVITISIEPTIEFNLRSGMASSTRNKAIELWNTKLPKDDLEKLSKILFSYENPPGTKFISGSQDSIGIIYPGINKLYYDKSYWPKNIDSINSEKTIEFIEKNLYLIPLNPRNLNYNVLKNTKIFKKNAKELADSSNKLWKSILNHDLINFGKSFQDSFNAQVKMFPNMLNEDLKNIIKIYKNQCIGYKLSGAGGGGYLILVSDKEIKNSIKIKIRRKNNF